MPNQWIQYIKYLADEAGIEDITYIMAIITTESTWHAKAHNSGCKGLAQISGFWIKGAAIEHFTDDYKERDLYNPYDQILTLFEMINYADYSYDLDLSTEDGWLKYAYWHATGSSPKKITRFSYFNTVLKYRKEITTYVSEEE